MFNLFEIIPPSFFNILTGPSKFMYANILYILLRYANANNSYTFEKEEFVSIIEEYFINNSYIELNEGDNYFKTTRDKATYVFRKLKECGWIDTEFGNNQEILVNLEDYAIAFLNTYVDFNKMHSFELSSKVYGIYHTLETLDIKQGYLTLHTIYTQAKDLVDKLRSLNSNIKKYIKKIININNQDENEQLKNILHQLLGEYKEKVIDKAYYYMKTNDNPIKYRRLFKEKCLDIREDNNKSDLIIKQIMEKDEVDYITALDKYNEIFDYLEEVFDDVISIMNDIDNKNAKYINVAIEKIRIIMNNNKDIEGNLLRILKNYQLFNTSDLTLAFPNIKSINNNSLFTPKKIRKTNSVEIIKEDIVIDDDEISKSIRNSMKFSLKNIQSYIENKLQNTTELTINDFILDDKDEFIKLLLTIIYSQEDSSKYKMVFENNEINIDGINMPSFKIERKDKNDK